VTAGGQRLTSSGFGRVQPAISTGGVVNDANFQSPVAPGSYVAIFGTGLSDPGFVDSTTTATLPLEIDGVTVSFDVPAAKISVPAHVVFVSAGQVNVQVPWELQGQSSAKVKVTIDSFSFGNVVDVPVSDSTPAFFEGNGILAAEDAITGAVILPANAAKAGQILSLFANGLGHHQEHSDGYDRKQARDGFV
jgi:minor extracellular serine protease Vpr